MESINNNPENPTLIGQPEADSNDIVQFVSEGHTSEMSLNYNDLANHQLIAMGDQSHSIEDILSREVKANVVEISTTDGVGRTIDLGDVVLQMCKASPQVTEKISAFYGMKCTMNVRVTVDCEPFMKGLYLIHMAPFQTPMKQDNYAYINDSSLTGLPQEMTVSNHSGYPSVMLNIGAESEVRLSVPYRGVFPIIDLDRVISGKVFLTCIDPLATTSNVSSVKLHVYYSLTDVTLIGASHSTNEVGYGFNWNVYISKTGNTYEQVEPQADSSALATIMAALKNLQPSESQEASQNVAAASGSSGPTISGIAGTIGNLADKFNEIPVINEVTGPVSMVANAVSSIGKMFGFSKPHDTTPIEPVKVTPFRTFAHADGNSEAAKLTLSEHAGIQHRPLGTTEEDEMSIAHIARRPCLWRSFNWSINDSPGKVVSKIRIDPSTFKNVYPKQMSVGYAPHAIQTNILAHTFLSYLANLFMAWRGSIRITFTVVANKFYAGRLRLVYALNEMPETDGSGEYNDSNYYYVKYIDIRDSNSFTIDLPYIDVNPFRYTDTVENNTTPGRAPMLFVYVENQLVRSATVADNINIWMSVAGGDDFQVIGPRHTNRQVPMPWANNYVQNLSEYETVEPQGFTNTLTPEKDPAVLQMAPKPHPHSNLAASTRAFGDPCLSLRTVMKRPVVTDVWKPTANTISAFNPWEMIGDPFIYMNTGVSYLDSIRALFAFSTGGIRVYIKGQDDSHVDKFKLVDFRNFIEYCNDAGYAVKKVATGANGYKEITAGDATKNLNLYLRMNTVADMLYRDDLEGAACYELPFYSIHEVVANVRYHPDSKSQTIDHNPLLSPDTALVWLNGEKTETLTFCVAAADDFNCGYLLGPPVCYYRSDIVA